MPGLILYHIKKAMVVKIVVKILKPILTWK